MMGPDDAGCCCCYPVRTARVGGIRLKSVNSGSFVQLGDNVELNASLNALAIQRESDHWYAGKIFFESYGIFSRMLPTVINPAQGEQDVRMETCNMSPCIQVGCLDLTVASSASTVHIGNGLNVKTESRIKHLRQYAR